MTVEQNIAAPQMMVIISSVLSLLSLVVSGLHCVFACKKPNGTFKMQFGSQSTMIAGGDATAANNDTTTTHPTAITANDNTTMTQR